MVGFPGGPASVSCQIGLWPETVEFISTDIFLQMDAHLCLWRGFGLLLSFGVSGFRRLEISPREFNTAKTRWRKERSEMI